MIIDCHGHHAVALKGHDRFHAQQIAQCTDQSALRHDAQMNARGL